MSDEPDSIILRYLRRLDEKMDRLDGRVLEMAGELRSLKVHMAAFMQSELSQDSSIASILARLDKVEWRLDLTS